MDVTRLVEHRTNMTLVQVQISCAAWDFYSRIIFQRRLSYNAHTLFCAIACIINICVGVNLKNKIPVVHVRVWWIMETQKYPACTIATR